MDNYYVNDNAQSTGEHEVHKDGCYWLSQVRSKTYLGSYGSCRHRPWQELNHITIVTLMDVQLAAHYVTTNKSVIPIVKNYGKSLTAPLMKRGFIFYC